MPTSKPMITNFETLAPLMIQKYERYLPTAFDDSMTMLEKVNKIIQYLNDATGLFNNLADEWQQVMDWVLNDGLTVAVNNRLDEMAQDGTLDQIINENIFNDLNTKIDGAITDIGNNVTSINQNTTAISKNESNIEINEKSTGINIDHYPRLTAETNDEGRFRRMLEAHPNGGVFRLNKETYMVGNSDIILGSNIRFIGDDHHTVIKMVDGATVGQGVMFADQKQNIHFQNIHFEGNQLAQTQSETFIRFRGCKNVSMRNVTYNNVFGTCVAISGCQYVNLDHMLIENVDGEVGGPGEGIYGQGIKDSNFSNISGRHIGDHLFYIGSSDKEGASERVDFVNCKGVDCGYNGLTTGEVFKIANDCRYFSFVNCHAYDSASGFKFRPNSGELLCPTHYTLTNCSAVNCHFTSGINFSAPSGSRTTVNAKISNCFAIGGDEAWGAGTAAGFRFENVGGVTVDNCDSHNNGRFGFYYVNCVNIVQNGGMTKDNATVADSQGIRIENSDNIRFNNITSIRAGNLNCFTALTSCSDIRVNGGQFDETIANNGTGDSYYRPTDNQIVLRVIANSGDGDVTINKGASMVKDVTSTPEGIRINLQNIPSTVKPIGIPYPIGSTGLKVGTVVMGYIYSRVESYQGVTIGLKSEEDASHSPLSACDSGSVAIAIFV